MTAALGMAGCSGPFSTLDPAGPAAQSIATLWWVMLAGSLILLGLVLVLLAVAFVRPGAGKNTRPGVWLVGGGLILPGLVLPPLLVYGLWGGERLLARPGDALTIEAQAEQWRWTFRYPDAEGGERTSIDVLHLPADRPVDIRITSGDVIHSFWVPRLAGKIDAIPGHVNVLRLSADQAGVYHGTCAEFCGSGHSTMQMRVEVHPSQDYAARIAELEPAP